MVYKARVFVTLKPSVFDPQGRTIVESLHAMGYGAVGDVRQGKYFELDVEADSTDGARAVASEVSHRLLANPVIESYRVDIAS
jgi:phosphoribosylformylglycinamidine synthase